MLKKVHLRLTLLCTGIPLAILLVISCTYLFVTESNLKKNSFSSFQSDMNTMLANLEEQTLIPHEWLSQNEGLNYKIRIWDNGTPLLFNQIHHSEGETQLFDQIKEYYSTHFEKNTSLTPYYTYHKEFVYSSTDESGDDYYACVAFSSRESGTLSFIILKSLSALNRQILEQRLYFALLFLISAVSLFLFARYFTQKLLIPVEESQKRQIQFISSASHELRTPLSVLLSAASACGKAQPEEQAGFLEIIRQEGNRMSGLIRDLLSLAEADRHSFSIAATPTEPDTLLLDTYEAFEPLAKEKGYLLSIVLPTDPVPFALCDEDRIRQVLGILIENGFAHTPQGSQILLALESQKDGILLSVEDNGTGIPPAQRTHVFDRFFQLDSSHKGTHFGLGLSIAQEIILAHHGQIQIKDSSLGGAAFVIKLPIA